jgi:hypothetical protein
VKVLFSRNWRDSRSGAHAYAGDEVEVGDERNQIEHKAALRAVDSGAAIDPDSATHEEIDAAAEAAHADLSGAKTKQDKLAAIKGEATADTKEKK